MRVVIDTNVLVAGLLWRGPPHALLEHLRGALVWVSSPALLSELGDVIGRPKFDAILERSLAPREQLLAELGRLAEVIEAPALVQPVCRDPDDDRVLALAVAAKVDLIVSGDADLLSLGNFEGIDIVAPSEALRRIAASGATLKT